MQIGYDGNIRTCGHSPFVEGNVFTEPFGQIWDRLNKFRKNEYVPEECSGCAEVSSCCGGCRYEGLQEGECIDKKDSRMAGKLGVKSVLPELPTIEQDTRYRVNLYGTRKEGDGTYILYNGRTLLVNEPMKVSVEGIRQTGFRLNDFPEHLKDKAETFGRILKAEGFLTT